MRMLILRLDIIVDFFSNVLLSFLKKDTLVLIYYVQVQNIKTEYNEISTVVTH